MRTHLKLFVDTESIILSISIEESDDDEFPEIHNEVDSDDEFPEIHNEVDSDDEFPEIHNDSRKTKMEIFFDLCGYSGYGPSRMVAISEFDETLCFGNGGSWCRLDSTFSKHYKFVTRKVNGNMRFSWDNVTETEKEQIKKDFSHLPIRKGNSISHIKVYDRKIDHDYFNRSVRRDIKEYYKSQRCVSCGNKDTEIDHKNGLYNDARVLNLENQLLSDFQALCRHCNLLKRQSIRLTRQTGVRYKATNIPMLAPFGIEYVEGDESYEESDPKAMIGTYWYDPVEFLQKMILNLNQR